MITFLHNYKYSDKHKTRKLNNNKKNKFIMSVSDHRFIPIYKD